MKTGDDLVALLGRTSVDPDVVDALAEYGVRWQPELDLPDEDADDDDELNEPDWYVWRPSSARGIEFGFQDRAHFEADAPSERGEGDLLLTSLSFFGEHEGVDPFSGRLPWGLDLSDSRKRVREKLSVLETQPRVHIRDVWEAGERRVSVKHTPAGNLSSVLVRMPSKPWPDLEPIVRPTPAQLQAMFGLHWHEEPMKKWLFPLGLGKCGTEISIHRTADLSQHGLELYFFRDPNRADDSPIKDKGAVMRGVKFLANRAYDGAQWRGDLPHGLSFLTAYPDLLAAVGRKPDVASDEDLGGYSVWHFKDHTMHVEHDNVDNLLWAISLFAPGAWQQAS